MPKSYEDLVIPPEFLKEGNLMTMPQIRVEGSPDDAPKVPNFASAVAIWEWVKANIDLNDFPTKPEGALTGELKATDKYSINTNNMKGNQKIIADYLNKIGRTGFSKFIKNQISSPDEYNDPILTGLMTDPVTYNGGDYFSKNAIDQHLQSAGNKNPLRQNEVFKDVELAMLKIIDKTKQDEIIHWVHAFLEQARKIGNLPNENLLNEEDLEEFNEYLSAIENPENALAEQKAEDEKNKRIKDKSEQLINAIINNDIDTFNRLVEDPEADINYHDPRKAKEICTEDQRNLLDTKSLENETYYHEENRTPLLYACALGNEDFAKKLLEKGVKIDQANDISDRALTVAARNGHFNIVKLLVEQGKADLFVENNLHENALMGAMRSGHSELANYLFDKAEDKSKFVKNSDEQTILGAAIINGDMELLEKLIKAGADVNAAVFSGVSDSETPLILAANQNNIEAVKMLLKYGAEVNKCDKFGETSLHSIVRKINEYKEDNNKNMIKNGELIINELLKHGANPTIKNITGTSVKDLSNHDDIKKLLTPPVEGILLTFGKTDEIKKKLTDMYVKEKSEHKAGKKMLQKFNTSFGRVFTDKRTKQIEDLAGIIEKLQSDEKIPPNQKGTILVGALQAIIDDIAITESKNAFKSRLLTLCQEIKTQLGGAGIKIDDASLGQSKIQYHLYAKGDMQSLENIAKKRAP
jgi:ankyrin repeat protein